MRYLVSPHGVNFENIDFGNASSCIVSKRPVKTSRTEIINTLCELLGGQRASEDSRPDRRLPWMTSSIVECYTDAGMLDYQALRYEQGKGIEAAQGDLPDSSLAVLGYSSPNKCGWYHSGAHLTAGTAQVRDWNSTVGALGAVANIDDQSFVNTVNECLLASDLPTIDGAVCVHFNNYAAKFKRGESVIDAHFLTGSEKSAVMQVCAQVLPWLIHAETCRRQRVEPLESCYCLIDDLSPSLDIVKVHGVMARKYPNARFMTFAFSTNK